MKRYIVVFALVFIQINSLFAQDIIGDWELDNGSIVNIYREADLIYGKIVKVAEYVNGRKVPDTDINNPDCSKRHKSLNGLVVLQGLKKEDCKYTGGRIYDPESGNTYYCSMEVKNDILIVTGSIDKRGILKRTMKWCRYK